jgi:hypothetical protein
MGRQRKERRGPQGVPEETSALLGEARSESDRADPSFSWENKVQKKAKEKDYGWLKGWLRVKHQNDTKKINEELRYYETSGDT